MNWEICYPTNVVNGSRSLSLEDSEWANELFFRYDIEDQNVYFHVANDADEHVTFDTIPVDIFREFLTDLLEMTA
jgi:hypothetical protein